MTSLFCFNFTFQQIKERPEIAFRGAIVCDIESPKLDRYLIKDIIHGIPILEQIGNKHKMELPHEKGDWMLNLRTGLFAIYKGEQVVSEPIYEATQIDDATLCSIRKKVIC